MKLNSSRIVYCSETTELFHHSFSGGTSLCLSDIYEENQSRSFIDIKNGTAATSTKVLDHAPCCYDRAKAQLAAVAFHFYLFLAPPWGFSPLALFFSAIDSSV